MAKDTGKSTPHQRAAEQLPLDDDVRWLPIETAHQRLIERTGYGDLAARDLEQALAQDRLPFMARSTVTGERKRLVWTGKLMLWPGKDGLRVMSRPQPGEHHVLSVRGFHFYIWQPTLETIWPPLAGIAPVDDSEPLLAIDRAKVVLRDLYATKAKMPTSLKEATGEVEGECWKRGWKPPSEDRVAAAAGELGYRTPRKPR